MSSSNRKEIIGLSKYLYYTNLLRQSSMVNENDTQ